MNDFYRGFSEYLNQFKSNPEWKIVKPPLFPEVTVEKLREIWNNYDRL